MGKLGLFQRELLFFSFSSQPLKTPFSFSAVLLFRSRVWEENSYLLNSNIALKKQTRKRVQLWCFGHGGIILMGWEWVEINLITVNEAQRFVGNHRQPSKSDNVKWERGEASFKLDESFAFMMRH